jgi:hypothetical protein
MLCFTVSEAQKQNQNKNIFSPLLLFAISARSSSMWLNLSSSVSAFLFWGVPAIYLTMRLKGWNFDRSYSFQYLSPPLSGLSSTAWLS